MTYNPIAKGTTNWDVPLNSALATLDANITSSAAGALQATNNLSDLTNAAQARINIGMAASAAADVSVYNVKDHGAIGNNVADDTSAIQYTLSLASGNGGGIVYFPPGTYKISTALTTYSKVSIVGSGPGSTTIRQASTTAHGITGTDLNYPAIKELTLTGPGSGATAGIRWILSSAAATTFPTIENVVVQSFGSHGISIQNSIVGTYSKVISQSNGGDGFHIVGQTFPAAAGTSSSFNACFANANASSGYYLYNMVYCALNACAADGNGTNAYLFDTCQSISAHGCGAESQTTNSFKITGGFGIGLYNCWIYQNNGIGIYVTGSAGSVVLTGNTDNTPAGGATNFIKVDAGCHVTQTMNHNTTANSFASLTTQTLDDTAGGIDIQGYAFMANQLEVVGNITSDTGNLQAANFTPGTWVTYSSAWTSSGTAPAIGNGSISARYSITGKTINVLIDLIAGSTTTFGTGGYSFSLPFAAASGTSTTAIGNVQVLDTTRWGGQLVITPGASTASPFMSTSQTDARLAQLSATVPQTLTTSAQIRITAVYERA